MSHVQVTMDVSEAEAMALAQMAKRFTYEDAARLSVKYDRGRERDCMLRGIQTLRDSLAQCGFAPR